MNNKNKALFAGLVMAVSYLPLSNVGSVYSAEELKPVEKPASKKLPESEGQLKNYPAVTHIEESSLSKSGGFLENLLELFVAPKLNTDGYKYLSNIADNFPKEFKKQYSGETVKNYSSLPDKNPIVSKKKQIQQKQSVNYPVRRRFFFRR